MTAVTVVIPTRNRREVLRQTLGTVLHQRGVDTHVIVVDEASDDGTAAYVEGLGHERITLLRHDVARGVGAARNAGTEVGNTRWVAWCDDDDLWAPDKLRSQLDAMARTGARWSCTGAVEVDDRLRIVGWERAPADAELATALRLANVVPGGGSGVLADRHLVSQVGGFREDFPALEDWDLWRRLAERSPVASVDRPLVAYRVWPGSMSRDVAQLERSYWALRRTGAHVDAGGAAEGSSELFERYRAKQLLRNGDRWPAAKAYASLARQGRCLRDVARAASAVTSPRLTELAGARRAWRHAPDPWRQDLRWLEAVPHQHPFRAH